mmetsp:Transcript_40246/g.131513  ORF Transcript_40246/g.131513 Transcript_40246/m.131513 type:complete len:280 (+) Transcript_40246:120-959(+)
MRGFAARGAHERARRGARAVALPRRRLQGGQAAARLGIGRVHRRLGPRRRARPHGPLQAQGGGAKVASAGVAARLPRAGRLHWLGAERLCVARLERSAQGRLLQSGAVPAAFGGDRAAAAALAPAARSVAADANLALRPGACSCRDVSRLTKRFAPRRHAATLRERRSLAPLSGGGPGRVLLCATVGEPRHLQPLQRAVLQVLARTGGGSGHAGRALDVDASAARGALPRVQAAALRARLQRHVGGRLRDLYLLAGPLAPIDGPASARGTRRAASRVVG